MSQQTPDPAQPSGQPTGQPQQPLAYPSYSQPPAQQPPQHPPPAYYVQPPPTPVYNPYAAAPRPSNANVTAGLVLGIIGLLVAWIPLVGIVAWLLNGLGMLFSVLGFRQNNPDTRTMSLVAMVINGLALLICLGYVVLFTFSFIASAADSST